MIRWLVVALAALACSPAAADNALLTALRQGDHAKAATFITRGVALDAKDESGATALMWAAQRGDAELTKRLLAAGADPDVVDSEGLGPLQIALERRAGDVASLLLADGANPRIARASGETALMTAARSGQFDIMKRLAAAGADVNARENQFHQTVLMWSAGYPEQIAFLIKSGADVHAVTKTWDVTGALYPHKLNLREPGLIEGRFTTTRGGLSALFFAIQRGDLASVKILLDAGAPVNGRTPDGVSPLLLALMKWNEGGKRYIVTCGFKQLTFAPEVPIANLLLDRGAAVNVADDAGYTPLHAAAFALVPRARTDACRDPASEPEFAKFDNELTVDVPAALALVARLVDLKADPNAVTLRNVAGPIGRVWISPAPAGSTPLHIAAESGNAQLMAMLVGHGGKVDVLRGDGHTPLSIAVRAGDRAVVEAMPLTAVEAARRYAPAELVPEDVDNVGAEKNAQRREGQTLLHIAAVAGSYDVISTLAARGVPVNARNSQGETALALAERQGRLLFKQRKIRAQALRTAGLDGGPDPARVAPDTRTSDAVRRLPVSLER